MKSLAKNENTNRRSFILQTGAVSLAGLGLLFGLTACGGGEEKSTAAANAKPAADGGHGPCDDPAKLDEAARTTRETFNYQAKAQDPAKTCRKCNFWQEPSGDGPCGGCTLVKGPINPEGTCTSWAEKEKTGA